MELEKSIFLSITPKNELGTVSPKDVSRCCDICKEGSSLFKKHRMHLIKLSKMDRPIIKCFNCGYTASFSNYLKEYHNYEYFEYLRSIGFNRSMKDDTFEIKSELPKINFKREDLFTKQHKPEFNLNLIEPYKNFLSYDDIPYDCGQYLKSRKIDIKDSWKYSIFKTPFKSEFIKKDFILNDYLIIPLEINSINKWYGFQAIGWKQKRFFTILFGDKNKSYNIYNWFNIDKNKPVYIFEGIFDCLSSGLDNSIAMLGLNINYNLIKELKEPIFCIDNVNIDKSALKQAKEIAKKGYKMFIFPRELWKFKDTNDLLKNNYTKEEIAKIINDNIYQGIELELKLKLI